MLIFFCLRLYFMLIYFWLLMLYRLEQQIYKSLFIIESDHTKSDLINYSLGNFTWEWILHNCKPLRQVQWRRKKCEVFLGETFFHFMKINLKNWTCVSNKRLHWLPNLKSISSASMLRSQVHLKTGKKIF